MAIVAEETDVVTALVRDVADFPQPGVVFKDITPLLSDGHALATVVEALAGAFAGAGVDKVLGIEARGFIVAAPVALRMGAGFVPVRKAGKLPWKVEREAYMLEYGADALTPGERVLIIDDVLATGGTASAAARLVARVGAETVGFGCILELEPLGGRARLDGLPTVSLVRYP